MCSSDLDETEVPAGLKGALGIGNHWQDLLIGEFRLGRTGNEILAATRAQAKAAGMRAQKASRDQLVSSYRSELDDFRALLKEGYAEKQKVRELERNLAQSEGQLGELLADIAATELQISETELKILQLKKEHSRQIREPRSTDTFACVRCYHLPEQKNSHCWYHCHPVHPPVNGNPASSCSHQCQCSSAPCCLTHPCSQFGIVSPYNRPGLDNGLRKWPCRSTLPRELAFTRLDQGPWNDLAPPNSMMRHTRVREGGLSAR